jgi:hypothetical protein
MGKNPAFQFYVKDWLSDPQLKMASHSTKGIWADMLCFMWDAPMRGELAGTYIQIQRMIGATTADLNLFLSEAKALQFCDISVTDNENVTVRNRRMWREEKDRKNNRERQAKFRGKQENNKEVTPPSPSPSPIPLKEKKRKTPKLTDEEWLESLKSNPAYANLDILRIKGKCEAWCSNKKKVFTRARFLNWLNREDLPMEGSNGSGTYRGARTPFEKTGRGKDDCAGGFGLPKEYIPEPPPEISNEQRTKTLRILAELAKG